MFSYKNVSSYKTYKKNSVSDWIHILLGISSINPRRCINGNNFIYMTPKSLKKTKSLSIMEKIKQVLLWKKTIQRNTAKEKNSLKKKLYRKIPTYSIDELILHKFPKFSHAFQELLDSSSLLYLLSFKTDFFYKENEIPSKFFPFLSKIKYLFPKLFKIQNTILSLNIFKLDLKIRGKKQTLIFPKKIDKIEIFQEIFPYKVA